MRGTDREAVRRRFHQSIVTWKRTHPHAAPFTAADGKLILIVDGIYFTITGTEYVCLMILLRPVGSTHARLRGLFLVEGEESREHWDAALAATITNEEYANIRAVVADGSSGLVSLCRENGWVYHRCHFHLLKDLRNLCSGRKSRSRELRQRIMGVVRTILDTPDEQAAQQSIDQLKRLIAHPECPKTVRSKVSGFLKHMKRFRACYDHPELNLPKTSNSAECVGRLIRKRFGQMHGVNTERSLRYWLDVIHREHPEISCRGYQQN